MDAGWSGLLRPCVGTRAARTLVGTFCLPYTRVSVRKNLFEIWAEVDFAETFSKFGGVSRNKNVGGETLYFRETFGGSVALLQHRIMMNVCKSTNLGGNFASELQFQAKSVAFFPEIWAL